MGFLLFAQETSEPVRTVINIENARNTKYEQDKETGNDIIILEGDVRISISRGKEGTLISAEYVTYNRQTEMLYASGSIDFRQVTEGADGGMELTANSLLFNTNTLEGFFDDGRVVQTQSDALNLPSGSTLVVLSDIFGRSESNTITFKKGELTFCDEPDPHWKIKASRIWLLPGNEFAFLNAVLYVGKIPVLYLPAFYYPKDELIFNPVFGFRNREGFFIQTSTYIFGRKPLDKYEPSSKDSSGEENNDNDNALKDLYNFIRPSRLKKQVREGIVLHNLEEDYTESTANFLKLMLDWYTKLGVAVGTEGAFKPSSDMFNIEGGILFGFSKTIFDEGVSYQPYSEKKERFNDSSNLFGLDFPFRYQADLKFNLKKPFPLSLSMPIYSDQYFTTDFQDRAETMDWIGFLTENPAEREEVDSNKRVSSFTWNLNSSYTASLPSVITPYLNNASGNLSSSINFSSKDRIDVINNRDVTWANSNDSYKRNSPERMFYYPSQITPVSVSTSFGGTIFSYPFENRMAGTEKKSDSPNFVSALNVPEELADDESDSVVAEKSDEDDSDDSVLSDDLLPLLSVPIPNLLKVDPFTYKFSYRITPSFSTQLAYTPEVLKTPDDIDLNKFRSSMYTSQIPIELASSAGVIGRFFTSDNTFTFTPVFQGHPKILTLDGAKKNGGYTQREIDSMREADYRASTKDIVNRNDLSVRPLIAFLYFADSRVTWRSSLKLFRREFEGTAADPKWDYLMLDWKDKDAITENAVDFVFDAKEGRKKQFTQSLTLTAKLPPLDKEYEATLQLGVPHVTFSLSTGIIERKANLIDVEDRWEKRPLRQQLTFNIFEKWPLSLTQSFVYNIEDKHKDNFSLSASWAGFRMAYTMMYTRGYDFESGTQSRSNAIGWKQKTYEEFLPYSLSVSYTSPERTFHPISKNVSLAPGVSVSFITDLLRPTNSTFLFSPALTFKINNALSLTFSATTKNSVVYRYIQNLSDRGVVLPGETNIFRDLINSFRFDNEELRESSGFKLQNVNLTITHDLHDWDLGFTFKMEPRLITPGNGATPYYDMKPYVTLSVVWRPMQSIKTEIRDKYGEWQLNPKDKGTN